VDDSVVDDRVERPLDRDSKRLSKPLSKRDLSPNEYALSRSKYALSRSKYALSRSLSKGERRKIVRRVSVVPDGNRPSG
jgi:hypothetical protein